jgi:phosphinothricin acetyltransferase
VTIRLATAGDASAIAAIYAPYVAESAVSFEMEPPGKEEVRSRILSGDGLYPWLVWDEGRTICGYAYASAFRARRAYRFAVETSAYVAGGHHGHGIGTQLYDRLIETLTAQGFTQAIAAVTLPNDASARLHESRGFVQAGLYRDVGYKFGEWRTVGLWQRPLAPLSHPAEEPKRVAEVWTG